MNPKRGQLYALKDKGQADGKPRPVLIMSVNALNGGSSVVAIPFYSQQLEKRSAQDWCVRFYAGEGNLEKDCVAKTDEISLIEKIDLSLANGPIGSFDDAQMQRVVQALKWTLLIT
jgi:mRNA-degrading endonuclease toxin of MazEF toxin-antitoxin module